jgi:hypothetical protein
MHRRMQEITARQSQALFRLSFLWKSKRLLRPTDRVQILLPPHRQALSYCG